MKALPISPSEVIDLKKTIIPDVVIKAFNHMIAKNFTGGSAQVFQDEVIAHIRQIAPEITESQIFREKWMDVEEIYRNAGWRVIYEKPAYNESGKPYFIFSKK